MVRDSAEVHASDPVVLLAQHDIDAVVVAGEEQVDWISTHHPPQLVLLDASAMDERALDRCAQRLRRLTLPAIALIPISELGAVDRLPAIDDFVALPSNPIELVARARRVLTKTRPAESSDAIRAGDLVINPAAYEVSLRGTRLSLRFKEYEYSGCWRPTPAGCTRVRPC